MKKILRFVFLLVLLLMISACTPPADDKVTLSYDNSEIEMFVGETVNIKPNSNGEIEEGSYNLLYELSDVIAEVDEDGNLTAFEEGILEVYVKIDVNPNTIAQLIVTINKAEDVFKITFDVNGGDPLDKSVVTFKKGEKVELPTPTKEGFIFLGWFVGEEQITSIKNKN